MNVKGITSCLPYHIMTKSYYTEGTPIYIDRQKSIVDKNWTTYRRLLPVEHVFLLTYSSGSKTCWLSVGYFLPEQPNNATQQLYTQLIFTYTEMFSFQMCYCV